MWIKKKMYHPLSNLQCGTINKLLPLIIYIKRNWKIKDQTDNYVLLDFYKVGLKIY